MDSYPERQEPEEFFPLLSEEGRELGIELIATGANSQGRVDVATSQQAPFWSSFESVGDQFSFSAGSASTSTTNVTV
jgi:hypothetical protein